MFSRWNYLANMHKTWGYTICHIHCVRRRLEHTGGRKIIQVHFGKEERKQEQGQPNPNMQVLLLWTVWGEITKKQWCAL